MKRRRLALIHYTAPPVVGGVEAILGQQAQMLSSAGHDVRLVAGRGDAEVVPLLDSRHPEIQAVTEALQRGELDEAAFDRLKGRILDGLREVLEDRELVVAHNVMTMHMNLPLTAALLECGRRLVAWTHDTTWENPRYKAFQRDRRPYDLLRRAQPGVLYVMISRLRQKEVARQFGVSARTLPVVPNGIDPERFLGLSGRTLLLARRAGFEGARPLVLVPVRITPRKRLELAVRAAGILAREHPGLRLVVSGPLGAHSADNLAYSKDLLELRRRLGLDGVVLFLHEHPDANGEHPVDDRTMDELYRLADAVLLTSEAEGFGLPVLEAGLARAPLVCPDLEILREVGGGGVLTFPAGAGPEAIAGRLAAALRSRPPRLRRRVLDEYSWPVVLRRTEAVLARA